MLWLIAKPSSIKHSRLCWEHFLEEDFYPNYEMQSELIGRSTKSKYFPQKDCEK